MARRAPLLSAHGLHVRVFGVVNVGWVARLKLILRRPSTVHCHVVGAVLRQLDQVKRAAGGSGVDRGGVDGPQLWAVLAASLDRPGVKTALMCVERTFGPILRHSIEERLQRGATAVRNRTLLHGDLHTSNVMYAMSEGVKDGSSCADIKLLDFAQAGWGHVAYELLYFMRFWSEERLIAGAASTALNAYYAALSTSTQTVPYSMAELLEDWSLAVVDWATLFLVTASDSLKNALQSDWQTRQAARLLLMLEHVANSDTKVGRVLRRAAAVPDAADPPRSRL
uniref:Uncharacterized protein n=1 Tax=Alexandrium andersonii TaxID=327968 RepID=A0A7S2NCS2_9DINO